MPLKTNCCCPGDIVDPVTGTPFTGSIVENVCDDICETGTGPRFWEFTLAGLTDNVCTGCGAAHNGTYVAEWWNFCTWNCDGTACTGNAHPGCIAGNATYSITGDIPSAGQARFRLTFTIGTSSQQWSKTVTGTFDCFSDIELNLDSNGVACGGWPDPITISPVG